MTGLVVQNTGSLYLIKTKEGELYNCRLKGNFKLNDIQTTNPVAVGDYVDFEYSQEENNQGEVGWITYIHPRRNYIIRRSSNLSKQAHILGSNLDRSLLLVTINYPVTSTTFIDRYLATAEAYRVETALVFNKVDRYGERELEKMSTLMQLYQKLGYRCFQISAILNEGLETIKEYIAHGVTLVSGHSGVGKSTFINQLIPGANLNTQEISELHNTGVHTTTYSEMLPYGTEEGTYLIDTPGIKGFGTIEFDHTHVGHYFREIFELSKDCRFDDCTHTHEPMCAVLQALNTGQISRSRYTSYLSILNDENNSKYRL